MSYDAIEAEYRGEYKIWVRFENGRSGVVDLRQTVERGGVFEEIRDLDHFKRFRINEELGVLAWGDVVDIAPETLYAQATGEDLPAWMEDQAPRQAA